MDRKRSQLLALIAGVSFLAVFLTLEVIGYAINSLERSKWKAQVSRVEGDKKGSAQAEAKLRSLQRKLKRLSPSVVYIVIDSAQNLLILKRGDSVLREAVVSCGSGNVLEEPGGKRRWVFDTPRGFFAVTSKIKDPSWNKPDWAFIEEGEAIPRDPRERIETRVLGEYALGFGQGYFIHGTLYTRLLGRNVTHGCIRMGDEDLEALFRAVFIGTPLLIF